MDAAFKLKQNAFKDAKERFSANIQGDPDYFEKALEIMINTDNFPPPPHATKKKFDEYISEIEKFASELRMNAEFKLKQNEFKKAEKEFSAYILHDPGYFEAALKKKINEGNFPPPPDDREGLAKYISEIEKLASELRKKQYEYDEDKRKRGLYNDGGGYKKKRKRIRTRKRRSSTKRRKNTRKRNPPKKGKKPEEDVVNSDIIN